MIKSNIDFTALCGVYQNEQIFTDLSALLSLCGVTSKHDQSSSNNIKLWPTSCANSATVRTTPVSKFSPLEKVLQKICGEYNVKGLIQNWVGSSIWYNKHIKLNNRYIFWKDWLTYGLKWTHQLFQDGICIPFSVLQSHFSLPSSYHSNYISLPAAAHASYNSLTSFHAPTRSTPITTSFLSSSPSASLIYKKLMDIPISRDKSDVECSWEPDLGESFPIPIWTKIWTKIRKSSRAANTTQTLFFIYNRLLITPAKFQRLILASPLPVGHVPPHQQTSNIFFLTAHQFILFGPKFGVKLILFVTPIFLSLFYTFFQVASPKFGPLLHPIFVLLICSQLLHFNRSLSHGTMPLRYPFKHGGMEFATIIPHQTDRSDRQNLCTSNHACYQTMFGCLLLSS